ncbi:MAG TPA: alpha/beta fold hydrolase [Thermoplasmata archaeon]|nr:alpha/beta fold hydrolase [Thermoplasmata archaeon]
MASGSPVSLHVLREGAGTPVVLLHGIVGDHTIWNVVARELAHEHLVLAPDLRGHGRSPFPDGSTMEFPELVGDLLALLDREGVDRAHLVGLSAGGFLALAFALAHPARVRSVTLVSSAGHCDRHTRSIGDRWITTYREEGAEAFALRLLKDLYYPDWIENHMDVADRLRESLNGLDLAGTLAWAAAIRSFDTRGRLGALRVPLFVIQGMDDQVVDPSHARLLRQTIQGTEVRLLAQTGHMVPVERPAETAESIRRWLARVDAKPSA